MSADGKKYTFLDRPKDWVERSRTGAVSRRKVIQIATGQTENFAGHVLYALCDDGAIWVFEDGKWDPHECVPTDEEYTNRKRAAALRGRL
jgi:hypothetical protein